MRMRWLFLVLLLLAPALPPVAVGQSAGEATTVVVVRHAEKADDRSEDPSLSPAGEARAEALVEALSDAQVSAIYSTQFERARSTAAPLAEHFGIAVSIRDIAPGEADAYAGDLAEHIRTAHTGETVVVVGHSNTVPAIVKALGGRDVAAIGEDEYERLFVLVLEQDGSARLVRSRYGAASGSALAPASTTTRPIVEWPEIESLKVAPADFRIAWGEGEFQFGELRLPESDGPHPVVVVIHGGCWRAQFDLAHISHAADALTRLGVATWSLEYRRLGNEGGGWPGTYDDVVEGFTHLRELQADHDLDLDRVIVVGHSAGGQLALWLAGRNRPLVEGSVPLRGVMALAPVTDLGAYAAGSGSCNEAVVPLMGGSPEQVPDRYARASPMELLPTGVPLRLLHGARDAIVPLGQSVDYVEAARLAGDDVELIVLGGAGHFDLIAPFSPAWPRVEATLVELLLEH